MSHVRTGCLVLLFTLFLAGAVAQTSITVSSTSAEIPRLSQPLVVDGAVSEWGDALQIPVRQAGNVAHQATGAAHQWRGATDASMDAWVAWNAEGVCIAAVVKDDDVRNTEPADHLWGQDSVELFLDGRPAGRLRQGPFTRGAYQMFLRPPVASSTTALLSVRASDGVIPGVRVAGTRTADGYTLEAVIPWSAFPGLAPTAGSALGLQLALNDADARDGNVDQPRMLTVGGIRPLYNMPSNMMAATLVDTLPAGDRVLASLPMASPSPPSRVRVPSVPPPTITPTYVPPRERRGLEYILQEVLPVVVVLAMVLVALVIIGVQLVRTTKEKRGQTGETASPRGVSGFVAAGVGLVVVALAFAGTGAALSVSQEAKTTLYIIAILIASVGCSLLGIMAVFTLAGPKPVAKAEMMADEQNPALR